MDLLKVLFFVGVSFVSFGLWNHDASMVLSGLITMSCHVIRSQKARQFFS